jgi:hypothetical protein
MKPSKLLHFGRLDPWLQILDLDGFDDVTELITDVISFMGLALGLL